MVKTNLGKSRVVPPSVREFRPEPFVLTKSEWAADNREQVMERANFLTTTNSGGTDIFTVPEGKTLYVIAANVSGASNETVAGSTPEVRIILSGNSDIRLIQVALTLTPSSNAASITYSMPLKFRAGDTLRLSQSRQIHGAAVIIGYLE